MGMIFRFNRSDFVRYHERAGYGHVREAYTQDGRLEIDNNLAENALRGIAVGRKNWLFAGADCGGERAAAMYSLLETAKLNGVNPQVWLTDVLDRIGKGHPINRLDELLPWAWKAARSSEPDVA